MYGVKESNSFCSRLLPNTVKDNYCHVFSCIQNTNAVIPLHSQLMQLAGEAKSYRVCQKAVPHECTS